MRDLIMIVGFMLLGLALYAVWGNLDSKLVALETNTGSYIYTEEIGPAIEPAANVDLSALREQLAALETAQAANAEAIESLLRRLEQLEQQACTGDDCVRRVSLREVVYFAHDDASLPQSEQDKIDRLLEDFSANAFVSLVGHADTRGDNRYNHLLSLRRAASVKRYIDGRLAAMNRSGGVLVSITASGEESVVTPTADNVEDPSNRIVEILVFE